MSNRIVQPRLVMALVFLAACAGEQPTEPGEMGGARGGTPGGNATPLTATPGSLSFLIPSSTSGTVTARVQFTGVITASTSDAACATVSPLSLPATKPAGSSVYVATFTVTAAGAGDCTITLTDKRGGTATVQVQVSDPPPTDGSRLLYGYGLDPLNHNLYGSNPDGSGVITIADSEHDELWAVFTPDRSKIIYTSNETGSLNLFRANPDGSGKEQMTFFEIGTVAAGTVTPAISPDGQQIAFALTTGAALDPTQIYVMAAVPGATPVAVTAGNAFHIHPTYAPDGRIVFARASIDGGELDDGVPNYSLWIMDGDGANHTQLTVPGLEMHLSPDVSPDGTTIAFSNRPAAGQPSVIELMDIDGGNRRALTSVGSDGSPEFSPDGARLAFGRIVDPGTADNAEIFVLQLGRPESEAVNITNSDVDESLSDWR